MKIKSLKVKNSEDIYNSLNEEQKKFWTTSIIDSNLKDKDKAYFIGHKPFDKKDVITWGEFVILNPVFLTSYQKLICWREDQAKYFLKKRMLRKYDATFLNIKKIFKENGITEDIWDMLKRRDGRKSPDGFPKKKNVSKENMKKITEIPEEIPGYVVDDISKFLKKDLHEIVKINPKSSMYKDFIYTCKKFNFLNHNDNPKVEDVLKIGNLSSVGNLSVLRTFIRIQQAFEKYKLNQEHGPFMKIKFKTS